MQNDECGIKKRWSGISCRNALWSRGSRAFQEARIYLAPGAVLAALHSLVSHGSAEPINKRSCKDGAPRDRLGLGVMQGGAKKAE